MVSAHFLGGVVISHICEILLENFLVQCSDPHIYYLHRAAMLSQPLSKERRDIQIWDTREIPPVL